MTEDIIERAKLRGMQPREYLAWRQTLRKDYAGMFPPSGKRPATWLGLGGYAELAAAEQVRGAWWHWKEPE